MTYFSIKYANFNNGCEIQEHKKEMYEYMYNSQKLLLAVRSHSMIKNVNAYFYSVIHISVNIIVY